VGVDIAKALDYLHTEKLLMHGDMKSGNVLIFGDFRMAKLCDFGVTMTLNEANGRVIPEQFYVGTQAWSAPEVIKLDETFENDEVVITCKADMFSYGESRSTVSIKSLIILIPCVSGSRFDHLGDVQFVRPTC
jgi:PDZ-binding kinase